MRKNIGLADRLFRVLLAALAAISYLVGIIADEITLILGLVSGIFILTSLVGFCPIYLPFGINTCKKDDS
jgi:hypothetical protein